MIHTPCNTHLIGVFVLKLEENSKRWGRQKQEMLTRLSEYKCGFARTSNTILHDLPLVSAFLTSASMLVSGYVFTNQQC